MVLRIMTNNKFSETTSFKSPTACGCLFRTDFWDFHTKMMSISLSLYNIQTQPFKFLGELQEPQATLEDFRMISTSCMLHLQYQIQATWKTRHRFKKFWGFSVHTQAAGNCQLSPFWAKDQCRLVTSPGTHCSHRRSREKKCRTSHLNNSNNVVEIVNALAGTERNTFLTTNGKCIEELSERRDGIIFDTHISWAF